MLVAGNRQAQAVARVVAVGEDGQVHFTVLHGPWRRTAISSAAPSLTALWSTRLNPACPIASAARMREPAYEQMHVLDASAISVPLDEDAPTRIRSCLRGQPGPKSHPLMPKVERIRRPMLMFGCAYSCMICL
jgi:hypothetical protein